MRRDTHQLYLFSYHVSKASTMAFRALTAAHLIGFFIALIQLELTANIVSA